MEAAGRLRLGRNLHCALVHYPVFLGDRKTGATSLTNLDVHDIARCSRTYGLGSFTVVTPLKDQQTILVDRPVLLLFGTGHGMAPEILDACDGILRPLRWMDAYNHLPVRGAVAITLDRVLGDCC